MAELSFPITVPGRVVTLALAPDFDGDAGALQLRFSASLARAQTLARTLRAVCSVLAVVGLAFVASRLDAPVAVGVCGLFVVAPTVWLITGLVIPLLVLRGGVPQGGGPMAMHAGVPITFDASGVSGGSLKTTWAAVTWVGARGDTAVLQGHDPAAGVVFEVAVSAGVFGGADGRDRFLEALRAALANRH